MNTLHYNSENRSATWLELFFDLVFVATIGFITHDLAHTHDNHLSVKQLVGFPLQFIPIWWIWVSHTIYSNRFDTDSKNHRLSTLFIMLLLVIMPAFLGKNLENNYNYMVITYAVIHIIIAVLYFQSSEKHGEKSKPAKAISRSFSLGALISLSSLLIESELRYFIFYAGIVFELLYPILSKDKFTDIPLDLEHLVERAGLLIIILQGEAVISLVSSLQYVKWNPLNLSTAFSGFIMIGAIWWIYFNSYNILGRAKQKATGAVILCAHLIICLGFIILANIIRHAILQDLERFYFGLLGIVGMMLFYIGKQIPYFTIFPPYRTNIIINSTVSVAITIGSAFLPRTEYALMGMTFGMLFYTFSNIRWTLNKDISDYLIDEEPSSLQTEPSSFCLDKPRQN